MAFCVWPVKGRTWAHLAISRVLLASPSFACSSFSSLSFSPSLSPSLLCYLEIHTRWQLAYLQVAAQIGMRLVKQVRGRHLRFAINFGFKDELQLGLPLSLSLCLSIFLSSYFSFSSLALSFINFHFDSTPNVPSQCDKSSLWCFPAFAMLDP